jgi:hypothetical protein
MRRNVGLFVVVGSLLPLVFAANASAQGANLDVSPKTASPGQVVTVTGSGYSQTGGGLSGASIRLSTRNGQELVTDSVDTAGRIEASFPVPNVAPGWYLIIAHQPVDANGRAKSFTPGRTRLRIVAPVARSAVAAGDGSSSGGGWPGQPAWLAVVGIGLILLATASSLVARRRWTHNRQPLGS